MSAYGAHHILHRRFSEFEHGGMNIIFGPSDVPLYTNIIIRSLLGRFDYRNSKVDLTRFVSAHDPYHSNRNIILRCNLVLSIWMRIMWLLVNHELPSQPNQTTFWELDAHTNPTMSFSRGTEDSVTQDRRHREVHHSPDRRFAFEEPTHGLIRPTASRVAEDFAPLNPTHTRASTDHDYKSRPP